MNKEHLRTYLVTILLFVVFIVPFIILGFYNVFQADDFFRLADDRGVIETVLYEYMHWTGRYFHNVLCNIDVLYTSVFFKVIPLIVSIIIVYTSYLWLFHFTKDRNKSFLTAVLIAVVYFVLIPSIPEGVYWWPGVNHYTIGPWLVVYLLYRIHFINDNQKTNLIINSVLIFIIGGLNALNIILLNGFLFLYLVNQYFNKEKLNKSFYYLIIGVLFGMFGVFAPGNFERANAGGASVNWNDLPKLFNFENLMFDNYGITFLILIIPFVASLNISIKIKTLLNTLLCLIGIIILQHLFLFFTTKSIDWAGRIENCALFPVLVFLFIIGIYISNFIYSNVKILNQGLINTLFLFVLFLVALNSTNVQNAYSDILNGSAKKYHKYITTILELKDQLPKDENVEVADFFGYPKSIFTGGNNYDPDFWINRAMAKYLNVNSFRLKVNPSAYERALSNITSQKYTSLDSLGWVYDSALHTYVIKVENNGDTLHWFILHQYESIDSEKSYHGDFNWDDAKNYGLVHRSDSVNYIIRPLNTKVKKIDFGMYVYETGKVKWDEYNFILQTDSIIYQPTFK